MQLQNIYSLSILFGCKKWHENLIKQTGGIRGPLFDYFNYNPVLLIRIPDR
jgi:hypothetical protein